MDHDPNGQPAQPEHAAQAAGHAPAKDLTSPSSRAARECGIFGLCLLASIAATCPLVTHTFDLTGPDTSSQMLWNFWWAREALADESGGGALRVCSFNPVMVAGYPAYEAVYLSRFYDEWHAAIALYLIVGEDTYSVTARCHQDDWEDSQGLLKELVYSFQPLR